MDLSSWKIHDYNLWLTNKINCGNVIRVNISKCNLENILHISKLFNLQHLICSYNNIKHINHISLNNLVHLDMGYNQITNVRNIDVPKLLTLKLNNNEITHISGVYNSLQHLYIENNNIKTIQCEFKNLKSLYASYNKLETLDNLRLNNCGVLICQDNCLNEINIPYSVYRLNVANNNISDISYSQMMLELDCHGNNLTHLNDICTNKLRMFNCGRNKLTKLPVNLQNAIYLIYYENNIPDISYVKLNSCRELHCAKTNTVTINNDMTKLTKINCAGNKITSLNFLHDNMIMMNIMGNPISNIDISLDNITVINCAYTNIIQLQHMPKLYKVTYSSYQHNIFSSYGEINKIMLEIT